MHDLIVVGAGVAGSVLTTMARERGLDVVLVNDWGGPASAAALALLRRGWARAETDEATDWYEAHGNLTRGALATYGWNEVSKEQPDWRLVDPESVLVKPDVIARVTNWIPGAVQTGSGADIRATQVVLSHPVWTSAPPASYGATALSRTAQVIGASCRVHWLRPYHAVTASQKGGWTRVGSSVAATPELAVARLQTMVDEATDAGLVTPARDWYTQEGARWEVSETERMPGLTMLGGLGRLGFTLAPRNARVLLDSWK